MKSSVCQVCSHGWLSRLDRPKCCPRCKRYDWDGPVSSAKRPKEERSPSLDSVVEAVERLWPNAAGAAIDELAAGVAEPWPDPAPSEHLIVGADLSSTPDETVVYEPDDLIAGAAISAIKTELERVVAEKAPPTVIAEVRPGVFGKVPSRVRVKPVKVQRSTEEAQ